MSFIYAQPLQGSPLRCAIDNLPAIGIDDSASFISEMSRKRERRDDETDGGESIAETLKEADDGRSISSARGLSQNGVGGIAESALENASSTQVTETVDLTKRGKSDEVASRVSSDE